MAKKSKKSIYKYGGETEEYGTMNNPYIQGAGMLGNAAGNMLENSGSAFGTIGGGTLKGAAAGTAVLPGIGTLVGGALGAIGGIVKNKQNNEAEELRNKMLAQQANMQSLQNFQNANKMYQEGGQLTNENSITQYNGFQHEQGGLPLGENTEVESGETRGIMNTSDYIFSDTLRPDRKSKKTFADKSKDIDKKYKNYDNDKFAIRAKDMELSKLMYEQEALKKNNMERDVAKLAQKYPELFSQLSQSQVPQVEQMQIPQNMEVPQEQMMGQPTEPPMVKYGGNINIKESKQGSLHTALGVPQGERIPLSQLQIHENDSPALKRKKQFAINARKWQHQYGGFIGQSQYLAGGGPIDPPKKVSKSQYEAEIERRTVKQENSFIDKLKKEMSPEEFHNFASNLNAFSNEFEEYAKINPVKLDDIQIAKLSELDLDSINMFDPTDYEDDYADKYYHSNPAALSQYKSLVEQNKQDEASELILGYFDKSKTGAGPYRESTHGEAKQLGNVIPVISKDFGRIPDIENRIPDIRGLIQGTTNYKLGGKMKYPDGGNVAINKTNPPTGNWQINYNDQNVINNPLINADVNSKSKLLFPSNASVTQDTFYDAQGNLTDKNVVSTYNEMVNKTYVNPTEPYKFKLFDKDVSLSPTFHRDVLNRIPNSTDEWGREQIYDRNAIKNINTNAFGLVDKDLDASYNWENPEFVSSMKNLFVPEDMENFKSYYEAVTGKPYTESYENIQNKLTEAAGSPYSPSGNVRDPYLGTSLSTIPLLTSFLQYKKYLNGPPTNNDTPSVEKEQIITGEPDINKKDERNGEPLNYAPRIKGYLPPMPPNDLGLTNVPFGWDGTTDPRISKTTYGENPLKSFGPDWLASGVSMLPNIGMGIGNLNLANKLNFDRTNAEIYNPDYVDPTRAIQESRNQYAGAKDLIRQNAGGSGSYLSNILGATAGQSEAQAGIQSQYDNANAGISNQAATFNAQQKQNANNVNAQIQQNEMLQKTNLKQQGYQNLSDALNTGLNTYYQSKRDADKMNLAGGENFYYKRIGSLANQKPVKVFKGNGFHYYEDPTTNQIRYLDPNTGKQIKDKNKIDKFSKEVNSSNINYNINDLLNKLTSSERAYVKQHYKI